MRADSNPSDRMSIDRSSWVTWANYCFGLWLAWSPGMARDLDHLGPGTRLMLAGVAAFFVAVVAIQRHMNIALTSNTFGQPQRLVTSGVFHYSRNPIYLAFLLPLAALGYFSPLASLVAMATYLTTMTLFVVSREEAVLVERFGGEFEAYRASTPRWLLLI